MLDIIIPAYNAHKTIEKTLLSICMQTMKDKINVYIVNDNSQKDYSNEVNNFKSKINIVELKLLENSGPGVARQYGVEHSNSEYIMFIDSDDILYNCFSIEKIFNEINNSKYDMAVGIIADEGLETITYYDNHQGNLHGKIYRRSFIEKNNIIFNNTYSSEDNSFNQLYLMAKPKIINCNYIVYLYRYNPNSITQKDLDYEFKSIKWYIYNMLWAVTEAEKRKFNKKEIAKVSLSAAYYVYLCYLKYLKNSDSDLILEWSKELISNYDKYEKYLDEKEKYSLYNNYRGIFNYIVPISFNEFVNQIKLVNFSMV